MALTEEWKSRVDAWRKELPKHVYQKLGDLSLEGFVTTEQLTLDAAAGGDFKPMVPGAVWGNAWQYGWFRTKFTLPEAATGKHIVLCLGTGGEALIWANGSVIGSRPSDQTLTYSGEVGTTYDILAEAYAGNPRAGGGGPVPLGRDVMRDPKPVEVGESSFGIWDEDVFQLQMDVEVLWQAREHMDEDSPHPDVGVLWRAPGHMARDSQRRSEIDDALREMTCIVDFEEGHKRLLETVRQAREHLKPIMAATNGTVQATFNCIGHGHLDVAWLWPLEETERKTARTIGNQLTLAEHYPEHKFSFSQPHLFRMLKENYPALYERLRKAVAAGQIVADGAMWVEADTNVTGGEALIRQILHGKRFFRDEFGVDSRLLWLPDVFGYTAALPQIMRGCGVEYFFTTKIFWNYSGGDLFPYTTFTWQGNDGSSVYAQICPEYNSTADPKSLLGIWNTRRQRDNIDSMLYPFGWGDGGGGPDRAHLESLRRLKDFQGVPKAKIVHPVEHFEDRIRRGWPGVRYVGELYLQVHRGTYTTQARTKRANRQTEIALREAEAWAALALACGTTFDYPLSRLDEAWKRVLLNQFHDVLPGSSIKRVYDEALALYQASRDDAEAVTRDAVATLVTKGDDVVVMNSLNWSRSELVLLPGGWSGATDAAGTALPTQACSKTGKVWAEVAVPGCGWTTLKQSDAPAEGAGELSVEGRVLENEHLRAEFGESGELVSVFDKDVGRELTRGPSNRFRMYRDVPSRFEAWDIDSMYAATEVELSAKAEIEMAWSGPLEVALRISRPLGNSTMAQTVRLRRGARQLVFDTEVDWHERHKLLKVDFDVDVHADEALQEIQFGHVARPTHRSRQFDADRFEVPCQKWTALAESARGVAVLNDCKYGVGVEGSRISLTLLKSSLAPDSEADRGQQRFTYALSAWNTPFADAPVVRQGYELNVPVTVACGAAERAEASLVAVDAENVVIETIKAAEDGSGDVVLRLYEAKRTATRATLRLDFPVAEVRQTNMLEEGDEVLPITDDGEVTLDFRPLEIKTLRLRLG